MGPSIHPIPVAFTDRRDQQRFIRCQGGTRSVGCASPGSGNDPGPLPANTTSVSQGQRLPRGGPSRHCPSVARSSSLRVSSGGLAEFESPLQGCRGLAALANEPLATGNMVPPVALTRASRPRPMGLDEDIADDLSHPGHVGPPVLVAGPRALKAGPMPGKWVVLFPPATVGPVARIGNPDHRGKDEDRRDGAGSSDPSVGVSDLSHLDPNPSQLRDPCWRPFSQCSARPALPGWKMTRSARITAPMGSPISTARASQLPTTYRSD